MCLYVCEKECVCMFFYKQFISQSTLIEHSSISIKQNKLLVVFHFIYTLCVCVYVCVDVFACVRVNIIIMKAHSVMIADLPMMLMLYIV